MNQEERLTDDTEAEHSCLPEHLRLMHAFLSHPLECRFASQLSIIPDVLRTSPEETQLCQRIGQHIRSANPTVLSLQDKHITLDKLIARRHSFYFPERRIESTT